MAIAGSTGATREQDCAMCDREVTHCEEFLLGHPGTHWAAVPHQAPCGRWCLSGGISKRGYQSLRVALDEAHGHIVHETGARICADCGEVNEP